MALTELPREPLALELDDAHRVLVGAHSACEAFLEAFRVSGSSEAPTDHEQDLLRAMVVFASAGLDSMVKQLVADALPSAILRDTEAREQFRTYVERRLKTTDSARLLSGALASDDTRGHFVSALVVELRSGSLQSVDELSRAASFFAIPTAQVIDDVPSLRAAFHARNQISHEMDVDFSRAPSIRRQRQFDEMERHANAILLASSRMLAAVDERLNSR